MLIQLALSTLMVIVTVLVHLTGSRVVLRVLRSHSRMFGMLHIMPFTLLVTAAIGIFTIHTIEIWIYAALYLALGAFRRSRRPCIFRLLLTLRFVGMSFWRKLGAFSARSKAPPESSCSAGRRHSSFPCSPG